MRWFFYILQLIFALIIFVITYAVFIWQSSDFRARSDWRDYIIFTSPDATSPSFHDQLISVTKHHPGTTITLLLLLVYIVFIVSKMIIRVMRRKTTIHE